MFLQQGRKKGKTGKKAEKEKMDEELKKLFPRLDKALVDAIYAEYPPDEALDILNSLATFGPPIPTMSTKSSTEPAPISEDDFPALPTIPSTTKTDDSNHYTDADDCNVALLLEMFPEIEVESIHAALICNHDDFQLAIDHLLASSLGNSLDTLGTTRKQQRAMKKQVIPHNFNIKPSSATSIATSANHSTLPLVDGRNKAENHRGKASEHAQTRAEHFEKASKAYKQANYGKSIAGYYSEEGRKFTSLIKQENLKAAVLQVQENSQKRSTADGKRENVLDLHYLRVDEALTVLEHELEKINKTWLGRVSNGKTRKLMVVTGRGTGRLFNAVLGYLITNNYKHEKADGYFMISL